MIDTRRRVATPEGVDFILDLAGPVPRVAAAGIDLGIRAVLYVGFGIVAAGLGESGVGLWLITMFGIEWLYPIYFEMYHAGRTPGKKMVGLQVLNGDGTSVTWAASILRNVIRFADFLPFGWVAGLVSMAATRDFQRLGDLAAGTVVVHRPTRRRHGHRRLPDVAPRSPRRRLTVEEQRAIVRYALRSTTWNPERSEELAELLTPLVGDLPPEEQVSALQGIANEISGRS